jgi:hypothetical protein
MTNNATARAYRAWREFNELLDYGNDSGAAYVARDSVGHLVQVGLRALSGCAS